MKTNLLMICVLMVLMTLPLNTAYAQSIEPVDGVFMDSHLDQLRKVVECELAANYPFDKRLYTFTASSGPDSSYVINYSWQKSEVIIFCVEITRNMDCYISYNDAYSLNQYYDDLCYMYGAFFRNWPLEDKKWFADLLPAHCELETYRELYKHPDWLPPEIHFAQPILEHRHGIPDKRAISEKRAREIADNWLIKNGNHKETLNTSIVSTYYYVDDPENPQWHFKYYQRSVQICDVRINAYTGEIVT